MLIVLISILINEPCTFGGKLTENSSFHVFLILSFFFFFGWCSGLRRFALAWENWHRCVDYCNPEGQKTERQKDWWLLFADKCLACVSVWDEQAQELVQEMLYKNLYATFLWIFLRHNFYYLKLPSMLLRLSADSNQTVFTFSATNLAFFCSFVCSALRFFNHFFFVRKKKMKNLYSKIFPKIVEKFSFITN